MDQQNKMIYKQKLSYCLNASIFISKEPKESECFDDISKFFSFIDDGKMVRISRMNIYHNEGQGIIVFDVNYVIFDKNGMLKLIQEVHKVYLTLPDKRNTFLI
jgi:hypothetical protein